MSSAATAWAWQQHQLSATNKLVLLAFAEAADGDHVATLQLSALEQLCSLSETTIRRAIKDLIDDSMLQRIGDAIRLDIGGHNTLVPQYRIVLDRIVLAGKTQEVVPSE